MSEYRGIEQLEMFGAAILVGLCATSLYVTATPGLSPSQSAGFLVRIELEKVEAGLLASAPVQSAEGDESVLELDEDEGAESLLASAQPIVNRVPMQASHRSEDGMMPIHFDLGEFGDSTTPAPTEIKISKRVEFDGKAVGSAEIYVDSFSRLSINSATLRGILGSANRPDLAAKVGANEIVTFASLRDKGLTLRYDPINDKLVIATTA